MTDFVIPERLRQAVVNYIGANSEARGMTWVQVQGLLRELENLKSVETAKPKLVEES